MSSTMDPAKLKVVELRAELTARGLDTKGNKPVLVKRLKDALEKELQQGKWRMLLLINCCISNRPKMNTVCRN